MIVHVCDMDASACAPVSDTTFPDGTVLVSGSNRTKPRSIVQVNACFFS